MGRDFFSVYLSFDSINSFLYLFCSFLREVRKWYGWFLSWTKIVGIWFCSIQWNKRGSGKQFWQRLDLFTYSPQHIYVIWPHEYFLWYICMTLPVLHYNILKSLTNWTIGFFVCYYVLLLSIVCYIFLDTL